jgi:hypothetical protein
MALFFPGSSTCGLCGHIIESQPEAVSLPFSENPPLDAAPYVDSTVHRRCALGVKNGSAVRAFWTQWWKATAKHASHCSNSDEAILFTNGGHGRDFFVHVSISKLIHVREEIKFFPSYRRYLLEATSTESSKTAQGLTFQMGGEAIRLESTSFGVQFSMTRLSLRSLKRADGSSNIGEKVVTIIDEFFSSEQWEPFVEPLRNRDIP